jgi:hypothetical protein
MPQNQWSLTPLIKKRSMGSDSIDFSFGYTLQNNNDAECFMTRLLLCLLLILSIPTYAYEIDTDQKVVTFGDVHGAYDELVQILSEAQVIDAQTNWVGGKTHLVSLGDLVDRGRDSRKVIELVMKLEQQAEAAGGAVHVVLGNHEVMVMIGDWRYISKPEYAAFRGEESTAAREALLDRYRLDNPKLSEEEILRNLGNWFPPGFLGLQQAYSPKGKIGSWLLQKPFIIRINQSLYMHGGISTDIAEKSLKSINEDNKAELRKYVTLVESLREQEILARTVDFWDRRVYLNAQAEAAMEAQPNARPKWFDEFIALAELEDAFLFSPASPIWYRGTSSCHPYAESFNTERMLKRTGTQRVVVGHTPNPRGAVERMDGLVIRMDTGMLTSYYKGRAAVLVEQGEQRYVQYAGAPDQRQPIIEERSMTQQLWGMSDEEMESLLREGKVLEVEDIGTGITKPWRVSLRQGEREEYTAFKYGDTNPGLEHHRGYNSRKDNKSDRYQYDMAAYKLDRLLNLQMVPVTVGRTVEGKDGAISGWIPNSINERDRAEKQSSFNSYCPQMEQYRLRFIWDVLTYNEDRNLTNIIWTGKQYSLRFIDHTLAFRTYDKRPKQYRKVKLRLSDLFREDLESLNLAQLQAELSEWLHPRQIEAIIERRDRILREAQGTGP